MSVLDQPFVSSPGCFGMQNQQVQHSSNELTHQQIPDQQEKHQVYALLAQALNGLTFEERQEQQEILHGVNGLTVEEEGFIDYLLYQLDGHLKSSKAGSIYEIAESMDPSYVSSRTFRVMFLRSNRYDARTSAEQMINFFEMKHQLFGIDKLVNDITIADLHEDDIDCLKAGSIQLAGKDGSGRQVFVQIPSLRSSHRLENELRAMYYACMSVSKSEETQLRGTVSIVYSVGKFKDGCDAKGCFEIARLAMAIPLFKAAIHSCSDATSDLLPCVIRELPMKLRARFRLHNGSHKECRYWLSTYGILPTSLPLDSTTNEISLDRHLRWVSSCTMDQKIGSSTVPRRYDSAVTPNPNDVLFTGTKNFSHEGNHCFRALVQELAEFYDSGTDEMKRTIVADVITVIHKSGARFLKQRGAGRDRAWEEVPLNELRKKIMQAFRNRRRRLDVSAQTVGNASRSMIAGEPNPEDVTFGARIQRSAGSELLHRMIMNHCEEFKDLHRGGKMMLVDALMQAIKNTGGRFLQRASEPGRWLEVSHDNARERIAKYFRNQQRQPKRSQQSD